MQANIMKVKSCSEQFYEGDVVITALRFSTREYNGQVFQDIVATDIIKVNR